MSQDVSEPRGIRHFLSEIRIGLHGHDVGGEWEEPPLPRLGRLLRVEEAVAVLFFVVMFVAVLAGVIWRFAFVPLLWTLSASLVGFMWSSLAGASLLHQTDEHIHFDLVYNRLSPRAQRWCRLSGNALIVITFAMCIPPVLDYLASLDGIPVVGMPITNREAFAILAWFLLATVIHRGRLLIIDTWGRRRQADEAGR
jgi:TRAP-type C4-dicarboxylate transport system permease small subunit